MSSTRAPLRLRLTAAQNGLDPRTHYWFRAGKRDYRRICDNAPLSQRRRVPIPQEQVCWRCHAMRLDDRQMGLRVFSLTNKPMGVFAHVPADIYEEEGGVMRRIDMLTFARFYAEDSAGRRLDMEERAERRRQRRQRQERHEPEPPGWQPYHKALLEHLRKKHWETNDIEQLASSDPALVLDLTKPRDRTKLKGYRDRQQKYVQSWRAQQADYFPVRPANVSFGELTVHVDPEIGMRPGVPERALPMVLKLWCIQDAPQPRLLDASLYLLERARGLTFDDYPPLAQLGVWDVHHSEFNMFALPANIAELMHAAADEYLALRRYYGLP